MTDSAAIFSPGFRALSDNAEVIAGGKLYFYEAGTTNPLVVYSALTLSALSSLGVTVDLNAGGYPVTPGNTRTMVYTGRESYRVVLKDAANVTIFDHDHVRGALDTSPFGAIVAIPRYIVSASGDDVTIQASQVGTLFCIDCSGGNRSVTLPNAVLVTPGVPIGIQHAGSGNSVTYSTVASQTIAIPGSEPQSVTLTGNGETNWIVSDGSDWKLIGTVDKKPEDLTIVDTTVSVAVAAVDFVIPAGVPGFRLIGTGLSCSTAGNLVLRISDDAGSTFEVVNGRYFRDNANSVTGADVESSTPVLTFSSAAASTDVNFVAEFHLTDLAAAKKEIKAHGSSANDNQAVAFLAESVVCDAINLVRVAFSAGNIDAGRIICQRL